MYLPTMTDEEFIRYGETLLDPQLSSEFERECIRRLARMAHKLKGLEFQVKALEARLP